MKFISFKHLVSSTKQNLSRFPFVSLIAVTWVLVSVVQLEVQGHTFDWDQSIFKIQLVCQLGFPLLLALALLAERFKLKRQTAWVLQYAGVAFLALYYFWLPANLTGAAELHFIRYVLLTVCFLLAITFGAYLVPNEELSFWQFNKTIVLRLVMVAVFTGTLFVGIAIAMSAVDHLFDVDIDGKWYGQLFFTLTGLVATQIFLAGVPSKLSITKKQFNYPVVVKFFAQYILIPLVGLYTSIVMMYAVKIAMTGDWPKGQLVYLVLFYAIVGMLSTTLLFPQTVFNKQAWLRWYQNAFFGLLIPASGLLFYAIWLRIEQYGITENRYFVVVLGAWVVSMALYFQLSKTKSIKIIPVSLFTLTLLASFGPWGAFEVAKWHQMHRLKLVLTEHGMFKGDFVEPAIQDVPREDQGEISGIFDYLIERHGVSSLQPIFKSDVLAITEGVQQIPTDEFDLTRKIRPYSYRLPAEAIMEHLGLTYIARWDRVESEYQHRSYALDPTLPIEIGDYNRILPINWWEGQSEFLIEGITHRIIYDVDDQAYVITNQVTSESRRFALKALVAGLSEQYSGTESYVDHVLPRDLTVPAGDWRIVISHLNYSVVNGQRESLNINGYLLLP